MKFLLLFSLWIFIYSCKTDTTDKKIHYPSLVYQFINIDTSSLPIKKSVYVPIYSHIYSQTGKQTLLLTATLSVRNISFEDSFYITRVDYFDSQGAILKHYLDSTILIKPMASIEFVVEESESKGGAGANFVVDWRAARGPNEPLIQAVMNGVNTGVSIITTGVEIK